MAKLSWDLFVVCLGFNVLVSHNFFVHKIIIRMFTWLFSHCLRQERWDEFHQINVFSMGHSLFTHRHWFFNQKPYLNTSRRYFMWIAWNDMIYLSFQVSLAPHNFASSNSDKQIHKWCDRSCSAPRAILFVIQCSKKRLNEMFDTTQSHDKKRTCTSAAHVNRKTSSSSMGAAMVATTAAAAQQNATKKFGDAVFFSAGIPFDWNHIRYFGTHSVLDIF